MNKRQHYKVALNLVEKLAMWLEFQKPYELNKQESELYRRHRATINYVVRESIKYSRI